MAVPVIGPLAGKGMVKVSLWQSDVIGKEVDRLQQDTIESFPCRPDFSRL
jgi:hypothetical protein